MTTLFIDADACPVTREALAIARSQKAAVVMVANATQNLARYAERGDVECIQVSGGRDAADFAIVEMLEPGDVVVTQDIGLAAMALGRGAEAISVRGKRFHRATIDMELAVRHAEAVHRRAGKRHKGPSAFEDEDREHFRDVLTRVLREVRDTDRGEPADG
ncbi:MAG: YaiI/YqxD family protein [Coriobacteriia bacterium]